jgi:hypothetical protein
LAGAVAAFREAIRLKPDFPQPHHSLGLALRARGELAGAVAAFREAIRLKPDYAAAHSSLGSALGDQGKLAEAVAAHKEALRLAPDAPEAHCNLGLALEAQGRFPEALASLRKGHGLGSRRPRWPSARSAAAVRRVERLIELGRELPAVLAGERKAGPAGQVELASFCLHPGKRLYAAAARFYAAAFAAKASLADDLSAGHRYNAACSHALAAAGRGADAAPLGDKERARLRAQALDWLRADLAGWRQRLGGKPADRLPVRQALRRWQQDRDLATVREKEDLAKLPEAERRDWEKLWADVAELLKGTEGK